MLWPLAADPFGQCLLDASLTLHTYALQSWIEQMSAYVHQLDPNHLVTVGEEGFWGPGGNVAANPPGSTWVLEPCIQSLPESCAAPRLLPLRPVLWPSLHLNLQPSFCHTWTRCGCKHAQHACLFPTALASTLAKTSRTTWLATPLTLLKLTCGPTTVSCPDKTVLPFVCPDLQLPGRPLWSSLRLALIIVQSAVMLLSTLLQTECKLALLSGMSERVRPACTGRSNRAGKACLDLVMHSCADCCPVCLVMPCSLLCHLSYTINTTGPADRDCMPVHRANQPELWSGPCGLLHQLDQCPPCRLHVPGQALCARGVWQAGGMPSCHSAHHFLSMHCPLQLQPTAGPPCVCVQ